MLKKRLLSVLLCLCMVVGITTAFTQDVQAVGNYGVNLSNSCYSNGYAKPQCTWYCWGRAAEKCEVYLPSRKYEDDWGDAKDWYSGAQRSIAAGSTDFSVGTEPRANSIAVFYDAGTELPGYGHVVFVEDVKGSTVYYSTGNYLHSNEDGKYYESSFDANSGGLYMNDPLYRQVLIGYIYLGSTTPSYDPNEFDISISDDDVFLWKYKGSGGAVTIPNGVTRIMFEAFGSCTGLTSVTIPNSVTSIGGGAFSGCTSLTSVAIPNSVTSIEGSAFSGCTSLTSVTIPNSVTSIEGSTFYGCSGLTSVTIPDSVTNIGDQAFMYCSNLTSITIPSSVTSIGGNAFSGCTGLTSVAIPNGVTTIGARAFDRCSNLTSVTIPNGVTNIASGLFCLCSGLTSVSIPSSVTSINAEAFLECSGLTNVTIPNSVASIGNWAFQGCRGLTSITIPKSVTSIGRDAFQDCGSLRDVYYGGNESDWNAVKRDYGTYYLDKATIHYDSTFCNIIQEHLISIGKLIVAKLGFRCPVDVEIYTADGQLVGSVVGKTADVKLADKVYIEVSGDEKFVYLLEDAEYTVKLSGTGDGTMTYSVENIEVESWAVTGEQTFTQVALTTGKKFMSTVNVEDSIVTEVETQEVKLYVLDSNGEAEKKVLPDGKGTEVPLDAPDAIFTISFDTTNSSINVPNMKTDADGKLSSLPTPTHSGYTFNGWFTAASGGDKITTETVFDRNTTVYAHWTRVSGSVSSGGSSGGGSASTTYAVEVPSVANGTITVIPKSAEKGSTVTITATPDAGYQLELLTVSDSSRKAITLTDKGNGKYTFTMPSGKVTVDAVFKPVQTAETMWSNPFADVYESEWYYDAVRFVHENGLMNGYGDNIFVPNVNLSRAMLAQILYNKEGRPAVSGSSVFSDVASSAWYYDALAWAAERGIVSGYGNGLFGPNDNITREQLAVMLWRYAGEPAATDRELHFNDADNASGYAVGALCWAAENGIINGKDGGILDPKGLATRAEVAQILLNYLKK